MGVVNWNGCPPEEDCSVTGQNDARYDNGKEMRERREKVEVEKTAVEPSIRQCKNNETNLMQNSKNFIKEQHLQ